MASSMSSIPVPVPLSLTRDNATDMRESFDFFKLQWENYSVASELNKKSEDIQVATLLSVMGKDCLNIYRHLPLTEEQRRNTAAILTAFTDYFEPKRNVIYERYIFNSAVQENDEPIDQYVTRLRKLADTCNFGVLQDDLIRDRLVLGVKSDTIRRRLLRDPTLNIDTALDICRSSELTERQLSAMSKNEHAKEELNYTRQIRKTAGQYSRKKEDRPQAKGKDANLCRYCHGTHPKERNKCPAYGQTCRKCGRMNHFAKACLATERKSYRQNTRTRRLRVAEAACKGREDSSEESLYSLSTAENSEMHTYKKKLRAKVAMRIDEDTEVMQCILDTGATCNVINYTDLSRIRKNKRLQLQPTNVQLKCYNGEILRPLGQIRIWCTFQGKTKNCVFQVVRINQPPLLSALTCQELELLVVSEEIRLLQDKTLTKESVIETYKDVFTGLGCLPGCYKLQLKPEVPPVQQVPRRIPVALRKEIKDYLNKLEERKIIAKVTEPTDWISNMVVVKRNKKLRICLDPRELNKALKRAHYQMPTIEEVLPQLANAKVFSVLDAKDGFWQIQLDKASSKLTTFWTPFGRYCWLRMPFGISTAPEEYQRRQHEIVMGLKGVEVVADDIIVYGCGENEQDSIKDHDRNLIQLLERARECNLKLNEQKFKFKQHSVTYMGHQLTSEGLRPDTSKIRAVLEAERPENVQQLQSLLGFVVYLSKFLPRLSQVSEPLRALTRQDTEWNWGTAQEEAYNTLKQLVSEAPVLRFYNTKVPVVIQCDASSYGLGAALLQEGQPIAFASKALTETECQYAQIEKECLAIVFACEKFAQYIVGRDKVTIQTDHKPLEVIFRKSLQSAPKRLQRMLLRLQRYNLEVQYKKGTEMYVADYLSRIKSKNATKHKQEEEEEIYNIYNEIEQVRMQDFVSISDVTLRKVQDETKADPVLARLQTIVRDGWPEERAQMPADLLEYWQFRDELSTQEGVIYKSNKVVIPKSMQPDMVQRIHASHLGIEASLRRARDSLFWMGMIKDITQHTRTCITCNKYAPAQQKEPLILYPILELPWDQVSIDIFHVKGENYMVVVDHYSDYWKLVKLGNMEATTVIDHLKIIFSQHGIPRRVITDNGPQFSGEEFKTFAKKWCFTHTTTSPYYSQSNGKAEAGVKIAKRLTTKAIDAKEDLWLAVLEWRNTPTENMNTSPVQRLMSRRTRTKIPVSTQSLRPAVPEKVREKLKQRKSKQKFYYDRTARSLGELKEGEAVYIKELNNKWKPAKCLQQVAPRSYTVKTEEGRIFRRNRCILRQRMPKENEQEVNDEDESDWEHQELQPSMEVGDREVTPGKQELSSTRAGRTIKVPSKYKDFILY